MLSGIKVIGWRDRFDFFFKLDQEIGQEWRVCSSGWQRWWSAALCMIGVDMSPALALLSTGENPLLWSIPLWYWSSSCSVSEGGGLIFWEVVNKDAVELLKHLATPGPPPPLLSTKLYERYICHRYSYGTIMVSAFNLDRKQSCHNCYHYPLHHYHQSCLKIIWRNHQWSAFISYANRLMLYSTFQHLLQKHPRFFLSSVGPRIGRKKRMKSKCCNLLLVCHTDDNTQPHSGQARTI